MLQFYYPCFLFPLWKWISHSISDMLYVNIDSRETRKEMKIGLQIDTRTVRKNIIVYS